MINRPGFAKFFFDSASEEREHAIKLIEYMLMRGGLTNDISQLIRDPVITRLSLRTVVQPDFLLTMLFLLIQMPMKDSWPDAVTALKDALKLEAHVTRKLRDIATTCEEPGQEGENFNDYHVSRIILRFML